MIKDIKIRAYKSSDEKEVRTLVDKVLKSIYGKTETKGRKKHINYDYFLVAEERKHIVGTIALNKDGNGNGRVRKFYVELDYQRRGIGQKLFNRIVSYAESNDLNKICASSYAEMTGKKFYVKNGFKQVESLENFPDLEGADGNIVLFERNIK